MRTGSSALVREGKILLLLLCIFPSCLLSVSGNQKGLVGRFLQGDFEKLNEILQFAVIRFPDTSLSRDLINVDVTNTRCTDVQVENIFLQKTPETSQRTSVRLDIVGLGMMCSVDFRWEALFGFFLNGRGKADLFSYNNDASTVMSFSTPLGDDYPPSITALVESCTASINVNDMNFEGGLLSSVLDNVETLLRNRVQTEASKAICDYLTSVRVQELVEVVKEVLEPYAPSTTAIDPLTAEEALTLPDDVQLLDFLDRDNASGFRQWFYLALDEAVSFLGTEVDDANGPTSTGMDLNLNVLLRNNLLQNRALFVEVADGAFGRSGGVIYSGQDQLTETTIILDSVKLFGLDTFTTFEPLVGIGRYTMQSKASWQYLTFEIDMTISIKPSTRADSFIENPGSTNVVERVKVKIGVDTLDAAFSLLLAVDEATLGDLQIRSMLNTDGILPCFLSTVVGLELTTLSVDVGNIQSPTLEGFISRGSDRIVSSAVDAAFALYKEAFLEAIPSFFQTAVRGILNKSLIEKYLDTARADCRNHRVPNSDSEFIDFRELLLPKEEALAFGGFGTERYGNLASKLMGMLDDQLLEEGADGLPKINSFIRLLTKPQSGVEGMLTYPSQLFHLVKENIIDASWASLLERVELMAHNASIRNLDSVIPPIFLLKPTEAHLLKNGVNIGPIRSTSLTASMRLLVSFVGENSRLSMRNEVEISISVPSTTVLVDIFAMVGEKAFLNYPLKDIDNYHCLLATIPSLGGNETFALSNFDLDLFPLTFDMSCISCSSPGGSALPEIMQVLDQIGFVTLLKSRFENHVQDVARSFWHQLEADHSKAPTRCPHNQDYNKTLAETQWTFPRLSRNVFETIATLGALISDLAVITTAKSHLLLPADPTNPLSGQETLVLPGNARLVDWTNLSESVGVWADLALDKAREYVRDVENGGVNDIIRNFLGDHGVLIADFDNMTLKLPGFEVDLTRIRINGLDTLSQADMFIPIGAQTLQNNFTFEKLEFFLDVGITLHNENETMPDETDQMVLSYGAQNIGASLSVLLAMDFERLRDLEIGAFLQMSQALPCITSTALDAHIPQLLVTAEKVDDPTFQGFISADLQETMTSLVSALFDDFRPDLLSAVTKIFDTTVRETLNDIVAIYRQESSCTALNLGDIASDVIDFRDLFLSESMSRELGGSGESPYGDLFRNVYNLMSQNLKVDTNETSINDLIGSWTKSQSNISGTFLAGDIMNSTASIRLAGLLADIEFEVLNALVENLDSIGEPLNLLQPILGQGSILSNTASFGIASRPLRLSARLVISINDGANIQIRNEVDASLEFHNLYIFLRVLVTLSASALVSFPLRDTANIFCWLALVPQLTTNTSAYGLDSRGIALIKHAVSVDSLVPNITCVSCTSPDFDELIMKLYSPALNEVLVQADRFVQNDFLQSTIDRYVFDASKQCPSSADYDPEAEGPGNAFTSSDGESSSPFSITTRDSKALLFHIANAILLALLILVAVLVKWIVSRRHRSWLESLSEEEAFHFQRLQDKERHHQALLDSTTEALFRSAHIPRRIRYLTPVMLLLTIGLHFGAHFGVLSTVNAEGQIAGQELSADQVLTFSFFSAATDTFRNGGKEMAVFMLVFNGIWPYLKLSALMVLWFVPPHRLSVSQRGRALMWIDVIVKLSIVDMFTMLVGIAAILVFIGGQDESLVGEEVEYVAMKAVVILGGGFYCLMIGQRLSRAASRFVLDHHNRLVALASSECEQMLALSRTVTSDDYSIESRSVLQIAFSDDEREINECCSGSDSKDETRDRHDDNVCAAESKEHESISSGRNSGTDFDLTNNTTHTEQEEQKEEESITCTPNGDSGCASPDNTCNDHCGMSDEVGIRTSQSMLEGKSEHNANSSSFDTTTTLNSTIVTNEDDYQPSKNVQGESSDCDEWDVRRLGGTVGAIFAGATTLVLLIIGIVLAPAISLDSATIWRMAVESGKSFEEAVSDFSVFRIIATLLLQARFVLDTTKDYVGLGVLIFLGIAFGLAFPIMQAVSFLRRRFCQQNQEADIENNNGENLPAYMKSFRACQHMEVYVIAFVLSCWQFSAIALYAIHYYCFILEQIYGGLEYIGVVEETNAQCFRTQAALPATYLILLAGFMALVSSFLIQLAAQYRRNVANASVDCVWI